MLLPSSTTLNFNQNSDNIKFGRRDYGLTNLAEWFSGSPDISLDEEVIGLGSYGLTLSVFTGEALLPDIEDDSEEQLIDSWTPRFARGR